MQFFSHEASEDLPLQHDVSELAQSSTAAQHQPREGRDQLDIDVIGDQFV